ncbi:transcriptional repressor [Paenibacillus sp. GD4]|uniref:Fur family transcriptional regulator n=1 Tax=Paenibacillus sp. GD4 TaxID=3068890 RepID=UPI002796E1C3|nr:transcriptional repressor [Paenibacillus sp. GD4]MDQ1912801.1 transcriptional repressor [Paenibacillus sp. GD4]
MTRKGLLTTQRKMILDIISDSHDHPTAADIIERLKTRGFQVAYATVYNSLRFLTEEGYVRELKLDGDASRYDARMEDHQHIQCTSCGRVDEVLTEAPREWLAAIAAETGYRMTGEHFLFKGVCAACSHTKN